MEKDEKNKVQQHNVRHWRAFFDTIYIFLHYNGPPSAEDIESCRKRCEMWGFPVELLEFPDENGEYKSDIPVSQKLIIED